MEEVCREMDEKILPGPERCRSPAAIGKKARGEIGIGDSTCPWSEEKADPSLSLGMTTDNIKNKKERV